MMCDNFSSTTNGTNKRIINIKGCLLPSGAHRRGPQERPTLTHLAHRHDQYNPDDSLRTPTFKQPSLRPLCQPQTRPCATLTGAVIEAGVVCWTSALHPRRATVTAAAVGAAVIVRTVGYAATAVERLHLDYVRAGH